MTLKVRLIVCALAFLAGALAAEVRALILLDPFDVELSDDEDGLPSTLPSTLPGRVA